MNLMKPGHRLQGLRERNAKMVYERFVLMRASRLFLDTRLKWLPLLFPDRDSDDDDPSSLDEDAPSVEEWDRIVEGEQPLPDLKEWGEANDRLRINERSRWIALQEALGVLAEQFGIAPWHVGWGLFVEGYDPLDPEDDGLGASLDAWSLLAHLVPPTLPSETLRELVSLAPSVGLSVRVEETAPPQSGAVQPSDFKISMELPIEVLPDLAVEEALHFLRVARDLLRQVGIPVPQRVRKASAVPIKASLVSHSSTSEFVQDIQVEANGFGVPVRIEPGQPSGAPHDEHSKTPLALVRLELSFPLDCKSKELGRSVRRSLREAKEILKRSGIDLGRRLRSSEAAQTADRLRLDGSRLSAHGLSEVAQDELDSFKSEQLGQSEEHRKTQAKIKSRRHEATKRFRSKGLLDEA
jgi:hypothetical protein